MPGWSWLVIGALLLGSEMAFIDAQFYLVFLGVAALLVGFVGFAGLALSPLTQWLLFAALSLLSMATFRKRLYQKLRGSAEGVPATTRIGDQVQLPKHLPPGQSCRVEYRGSTWTARNIDDLDLSGTAEIAQIDGLTLLVRRPE